MPPLAVVTSRPSPEARITTTISPDVIALAGSVLVTHGSYDMSMQWVSGPDSTDQQQPQRSLYAQQLGAYAATMMRLASLNGRRW